MLQKESQVVTGASLRKGLVQAIPACVRLAPCAMSMPARRRGARPAHRSAQGRKWPDRELTAYVHTQCYRL